MFEGHSRTDVPKTIFWACGFTSDGESSSSSINAKQNKIIHVSSMYIIQFYGTIFVSLAADDVIEFINKQHASNDYLVINKLIDVSYLSVF